MKINWGWGLAIFLMCFMTAMLSFVYFTTTQQVNLVDKNYYPKGVSYQDRIEQTQKANALHDKIRIVQNDGKLEVHFPSEMINKAITGKLLFSHIEDYKFDYQVEINLSADAKQLINTDSLRHNRYILKADWVADSVAYYQEIDFRVE